MIEPEELWTAAAQLLRAQVSEAVWFSTFQDVMALSASDSMLRISVPSTHVRDKILTPHLPLVRDALDEIGARDLHLDVDVAATARRSRTPSSTSPPPPRSRPALGWPPRRLIPAGSTRPTWAG
ncbi:MAG: hypothetical protein R2705_07010 [Ilumatobacteraceae bacterium]